MTISGIVSSVEKDNRFQEWRRGNKTPYLSSMFAMAKDASLLTGSDSDVEWLLSYYDKEEDTFTTFSSNGKKNSEKEQAFKKKATLPKLDPGSVKVEAEEAIKIAEKARQDGFSGETPGSVIAILQPLTDAEISGRKSSRKEANPVWNITYITASYSVINIKIDAETGKVLAGSSSRITDFVQKDSSA